MSATPEFDLTSGSLCLDFANTVEDRPRGDKDSLFKYGDLLRWAGQTGTLSAKEARALGRRAGDRPRRAAAAFTRALDLRETLYRVFARLAGSKEPDPADLRRLNAALAEALPHLAITPEAAGYGWSWRDGVEWDRPLWPIVRSAADLLTSGEVAAVRECAADECSWLFVDRSRNRRRRWCDMATCGNRAKARRHYERRKGARTG